MLPIFPSLEHLKKIESMFVLVLDYSLPYYAFSFSFSYVCVFMLYSLTRIFYPYYIENSKVAIKYIYFSSGHLVR